MTDAQQPRPFWWRYNPANPSDAAVLAVLRSGAGRQPGDVPAMWPYYSELTAEGDRTGKLNAEHLALTVFGIHQQGQRRPVHDRDAPKRPTFANTLGRLRASGRFSEEALDQRFAQAANAPDLDALGYHLRGLVTMLKKLPESGFDYDRLCRDLYRWQRPEKAPRVRLDWGIEYLRPRNAAKTTTTKDAS